VALGKGDKNEKQTEGHKAKIHPFGEWPKNITVRIPLSVKILIAFRPQCPGSIRLSKLGLEEAYAFKIRTF
jgi:hypothetical protein